MKTRIYAAPTVKGSRVSASNVMFEHQTQMNKAYISHKPFKPFKPEFTFVIFIHYKLRIAVAILDL